MLFNKKNAFEKRKDFRNMLDSGKLLRFPGSWSPLVSMLIEQKGFDGVYISGAVLSNDLGLPDIGMTTLTEVSQRGRAISKTTDLPSIIDIDTGFGEPMSVVRTVQELEDLGLAGCHLEDQVNPKRCGHLDNKSLVSVEEMCKKVKAAADGKRDKNFIIIARTDSRASEGLDAAIDRAKAYVDAGADMIFPEAMKDESEFEAFRKAIDVPLLANMTEFGKSRLLSYNELSNLGYNLVIYPVTTLRLAMKAVEDGLDHILKEGSQEGILESMQHRKRLYEVLHYEDYNKFDQGIFNFKL
ncbi:MAG: methylisocitrate lyase [Bdellovibrionales bacterium]|jgi:methylisocitrate lyase|nr:methylisocitrate lyase [Bdellovibrionales bacterium]